MAKLSDFTESGRFGRVFNKFMNETWEKIKDSVNANVDDIASNASDIVTNASGIAEHDVVIKEKIFTAPDSASATAVHSAITLADGETTEVTENITNPDMPRIVTIKGNQAGVTGDVVITGTNRDGDTITETISSDGSSEVLGTKAFETVASITVPELAGAGDTISVGIGVKLGIGRVVSLGYPIYTIADGTKETTDPTITTDTSMESNLISFDTAPDGSKDFEVYYID